MYDKIHKQDYLINSKLHKVVAWYNVKLIALNTIWYYILVAIIAFQLITVLQKKYTFSMLKMFLFDMFNLMCVPTFYYSYFSPKYRAPYRNQRYEIIET